MTVGRDGATADTGSSGSAGAHDEAAQGGASAIFRVVGQRVRQLRTTQHLTLDDLSARSGVSRRMITMLEAGETNASLGTLDKLARALSCDFYTMIAGRPVAPLSPETAREVVALWEDGKGSSARLLISHPRASVTELWQWQLVGGARYQAEADPPGSEEILLVSSGRLVVEVGDDRYPLAAGGYLRLPSDVPYAYGNPGRATAHFLRIIVMP
jgi:transcriptional regulator with XRE-family HTH domain